MDKVVAIIAARNEEEHLSDTIQSIKDQTYPINHIIVINDGSTDETPKIAEKHGCETVNLPYHLESYIGYPCKLSWVWNQGLREAREKNPDKLLMMGADTVLPPDYVQRIINRMRGPIMVASGKLTPGGFNPNTPRGSGRIINTDFWVKANDLQYPQIPGWESWINHKSLQLGYKNKCFEDIVAKTRPPTRTQSKGYSYGRAMATNGYFITKVINRICGYIIRDPSFGLGMVLGYIQGKSLEKSDVANFVNERQRNESKRSLERWINKIRRYRSFHTGKTSLKHPPTITSIELTNRCNLNCAFCAREEVKKHRGYGDMPYNEYLNILEKYPNQIEQLRLFQHGEPTLYKRLQDAIQDAHTYADVFSVGFTTNGNFPTDKLIEYYESGLTDICFSFEGTDKETYEKIRLGGDYNLVEQNIKTSYTLKKKYPNVGTTLNIVETDQTRPKIKDFIDKWSPYIDKIKVSKLHNWGGEIHLDPELGYASPNQPPNCFAPYHTVKILYDGSIVPCCSWLYEPMGNISKENLNDVWNNEKYQDLRRRLSKNRSEHPKCRDCNIRVGWGKWNDIHERNSLYFLDSYFLNLLSKPLSYILKMVKTS